MQSAPLGTETASPGAAPAPADAGQEASLEELLQPPAIRTRLTIREICKAHAISKTTYWKEVAPHLERVSIFKSANTLAGFVIRRAGRIGDVNPYSSLTLSDRRIGRSVVDRVEVKARPGEPIVLNSQDGDAAGAKVDAFG